MFKTKISHLLNLSLFLLLLYPAVTYAQDNIADVVIVDIAAGCNQTLALDNLGNVWISGFSEKGELGLQDVKYARVFVKIPEIPKIKHIAAGGLLFGGFSLIVDENGEVWGTGLNDKGQLGLGDLANRNKFVKVPNLKEIAAVAAGADHAVALDSSGEVLVAGSNGYGKLGLGESDYNFQRSTFSKVPGVHNIVAISAGESHTLLLDAKGQVWGAGGSKSNKNPYMLGFRENEGDWPVTRFTLLEGLYGIRSVEAGLNDNSYVIDDEGALLVTGSNSFGSLGVETKGYVYGFTKLPLPSDVKSIASHNGYAIALDANGSLWGTGDNESGQLALGEKNIFGSQHYSFTKIPAPKGIRKIAAGWQFLIALDDRGRLWGSGNNINGQLGLGYDASLLRLTEVTKEAWANVYDPQAGSAPYYYRQAEQIQYVAAGDENDNDIEREKRRQARKLYDQAIEADPGYIPAYIKRHDLSFTSEGNFFACTAAELGDHYQLNFIKILAQLSGFTDALEGKNAEGLKDSLGSGNTRKFAIDEECQQLKPDIALFLADKYFNIKNYEQAIIYYSNAIIYGKSDRDIYKNRSTSYYYIGNISDSTADARITCEQGDCEILYWMHKKGILEDQAALKAKLYYEEGEKYYEEQDYTEAIEMFTKAIEADPSYGEAFLRRAISLANIDEHEKAVDDYFKAFDVFPERSYIRYLRGRSFFELQKFERAIKEMTYAIEIDPDPIYFSGRAFVELEISEYQKAIDDATKAIELDPTDGLFYSIRGKAYLALGQHNEASLDADKACELNACELRNSLNGDSNPAL
jgi:alpha-tubulin suppressor-like RCC1 family protein/Tfp pilus assembly protein PilF